MDISFPYGISKRARTASSSDHIRELITQVLFTSPGERVNRPDFGAGLGELLFAPGGEETAATTRMLIHGALQRWMSDLIRVEGVNVVSRGDTLEIHLSYIEERTQEPRTITIEQRL